LVEAELVLLRWSSNITQRLVGQTADRLSREAKSGYANRKRAQRG
jgi:hypothetical protein